MINKMVCSTYLVSEEEVYIVDVAKIEGGVISQWHYHNGQESQAY